nr:hypothetical protein [Kofleriaceae bacterium]
MRSLWWLVVVAGCVSNLDPEWQLNHDRVIAVRASPPHIPAGSASVLDALVSHKGSGTGSDATALPVTQDAPLLAMLGSGQPLAFAGMDLVSQGSDGSWIVTAPDDTVLDAARSELGIAAGSDVPLSVITVFGTAAAPLPAIKTVELGDSVDNPTLGAVTFNGSAVGSDASLELGSGVDVPFSIDEPMDDTVNWLTGVGTLHDDDEHAAFDNVGSDDPRDGQLVVVVRTPDDGVAWETWPLHTVGGSAAE